MKKLTILLIVLLFSLPSFGKVKLPSIFADDMVLQRNTKVKIWGWGSPGETVTIKAGWLKNGVTVKTDSEGKWLAELKTGKAGGPYTISVKGENEILLNNILLGEVWICSGQSNMEYTIKMFGGWDVNFLKDKEDFEKNDYSKIRFCQVDKAVSKVPLDTCKAQWMVPSVENLENFSAAAYFFGRELYNRLKVPVALISTNWGGTPAEAWTDLKYLQDDKDLNYYLNINNNWEQNRPAELYNAMINPLIDYTIRGVIWYQGEANVDNANLYTKLFATMIKCWRDKWGIGDFPFYYVQIAPFNYGDDFNASAYLREAQLNTLAVTKNTGMAVTMDIGNPENIHPTDKQDVGKRLALWALAKTYNVKVPGYSGPVYKSFKKEGNKIRLFFDHTGKGLKAGGDKLSGFKIAGSDMKFVDADAVIDKNTVLVSSNEVPEPAAVRFAFTNTGSSNLYNSYDLPASSFRTDTIRFYKPDIFISASVNKSAGALEVKLSSADKNAVLHYTTDGSEPVLTYPEYKEPVLLSNTAELNAKAFSGNTPSINSLQLKFEKHLAFGKPVSYKEPYSAKYAASKEYTLTDGVRGGNNFNDGFWQGFQSVNFDVTIDLGAPLEIHTISAGFLRAMASWIFPPKKVEFYTSDDGINFTKKFEIVNPVPTGYGDVAPETYTAPLQNTTARFVRVFAENQNTIPEWHQGKGGKAWLFADEIIVK